MSHFTVLVIGEDHETALQPFHEFECTGTDDQYVQNIDETADKRAEYACDTETVLTDPQGGKHYLYDGRGNYDPRFCREEPDNFLGDLLMRKVKHIPDGWTEGEVPACERRTFAQWLEYQGTHAAGSANAKFGFYETDAAGEVIKVVRRTNPNRQWDWWVVGGQWSGLLKLKPGAHGLTGETGLMGSHHAKGADRADQARKGDIDWSGMRDEAEAKAREKWNHANAVTGGEKWHPWAHVREVICKGSIEAAREFYREQPAVKKLKAADPDRYGWDLDDTLAWSLDNYIQRARDGAGSTFAVLKDGQWYERGSMGWWGVVSDEKDTDEWHKQFAALIDGLPDDALLTVVDCHI